MNPLLHLHLGHPPQGANQVLAGLTMPASLGEVEGNLLLLGTQNELFMVPPGAEESKKDRAELLPVHTEATSGKARPYSSGSSIICRQINIKRVSVTS